jgi:membrane fusion protein, protease secretion system
MTDAAVPTTTAPWVETDPVDLNDARPQRWGWGLLLVGLGAFLAWSLLAPLDAAVTTQGAVVVSGNRKLVQPAMGGKVSEILVRDGDEVRKGQVVLRLEDTPSRSQLDMARGQWLVARATEARLQAELMGTSQIDFPPELMELAANERVAEVMELQSRLLESRLKMRASELRTFDATLSGLAYQLQGQEAARQAKETQGRMLNEELRNQRTLANEGFFPRNRLSEQERAAASMQGAVAEDTSNAGRTRQAISEVQSRRLAREQELRKDTESQLSDVQREVTALDSRIRALEFDLANTEVRAPVDGLVMALATHTVGGMVSPGATLLEVVPKNEGLRIEAQIPSHLVDKVHPGLEVHLLFSAFNQATTPRIEGRVVQISADALADARLNTSYYKLVIDVTPEGAAKLRQHEIRAGMPVEVFIKTGERTFMSYLLKPLLDRMNRALIEP